jgi:hypothetical protein
MSFRYEPTQRCDSAEFSSLISTRNIESLFLLRARQPSSLLQPQPLHRTQPCTASSPSTPPGGEAPPCAALVHTALPNWVVVAMQVLGLHCGLPEPAGPPCAPRRSPAAAHSAAEDKTFETELARLHQRSQQGIWASALVRSVSLDRSPSSLPVEVDCQPFGKSSSDVQTRPSCSRGGS